MSLALLAFVCAYMLFAYKFNKLLTIVKFVL